MFGLLGWRWESWQWAALTEKLPDKGWLCLSGAGWCLQVLGASMAHQLAPCKWHTEKSPSLCTWVPNLFSTSCSPRRSPRGQPTGTAITVSTKSQGHDSFWPPKAMPSVHCLLLCSVGPSHVSPTALCARGQDFKPLVLRVLTAAWKLSTVLAITHAFREQLGVLWCGCSRWDARSIPNPRSLCLAVTCCPPAFLLGPLRWP